LNFNGWKMAMSIPKSSRLKTFLSALSVLVVIAGTLFGANIAAADSIQVQGYQRASQSEACVAQVGETPWQASWGPDATWKPGWEQWANAGKGGWVCTRSITWARDSSPSISCATGGTYAVGDIGPGCGLVFLISGGKTYEMAPKNWNGGVGDPVQIWTTSAGNCYAIGSSTADEDCQKQNLYPGTSGEQGATSLASNSIGMGPANTTAIKARMDAGSAASSSYAAGVASAYSGGGFTDWFLPSKDELNAMCNYSRSPSSPALPSVGCWGTFTSTQDTAFASGTYGFASSPYYWSSSQKEGNQPWYVRFDTGRQNGFNKDHPYLVRPVRSF
jgi:hypothetical protein